MAGFDEYGIAIQFRDWVRETARTEIAKWRPEPRMAQVVSIDAANKKCGVLFTGEQDPVIVAMGSQRPAYLYQKVLVGGPAGSRYIVDIFGGGIPHEDSQVAYFRTSTTNNASPATGFLSLNNATLSSVTTLYLSHADQAGIDVTNLTHILGVGSANLRGVLTLTRVSNPSQLAVFTVTGGLTHASAVDTIACTHKYSVGSFGLNDLLCARVQPVI